MDSTLRVRRRVVIKRINDAHLCAKRCMEDSSCKTRFATWCDRIEEMYQTFTEVHEKILSYISEEDNPDAFNEEDEIRQSFDDTYSDILEIKYSVFGVPRKTSIGHNTSIPKSGQLEECTAHSKPQVKLPRIALKTFDGTFKNWLPFKDLFETLINKNESLSNVEKFSYLVSSLQGSALDVVKVFPLSDANYEEAYKALRNRFENKRHLAFISWEAILTAKLGANNATSLRQLLDIVNENLAILKNLDLPVEQWDFLLFHTLLTKLHPSTRKEFELSMTSSDIPSFDTLKSYVIKYCQAWERSSTSIEPSPTTAVSVKTATPKRQTAPVAGKPDREVQHTTLLASTDHECSYCAKGHFITQCPGFQSLSTQKRFEVVKARRWCVNCLRTNHSTHACRSKTSCTNCGRRHNTMLHFESSKTPPDTTNKASSSSQGSAPSGNAVHVLTNTVSCGKTVLLSTAVVEVLDNWGNYQSVRLLLDSGSQANFMTETCARRLGLKKSQSGVPIYGLTNSEVCTDLGKVHCTLRPRGNSRTTMACEAIVMPKICTDMPSSEIDNSRWKMFKDVLFADPTHHIPGSIDMLLGAELWPTILQPGSIPATATSPMALNTIFGWVLLGSVPCEVSNRLNALLAISDQGLNVAVQRLWELEDIPGEFKSSPEDDLCEELFSSNHSRTEQGRYVVELPLKQESPDFIDMRSIALRRFYACENRLKQNVDLYRSYSEFMKDYEVNHHMTKVPAGETHRPDAYYIPHHCVINENSASTRLRVVFDASAKDKTGKSLNQCQFTGPKLQTDIFAILLRFRLHKVVFTTDIRQMYRQILVSPTHRHLQRILWRYDPSLPVEEYDLNTVTYGVSSSPFLALRVVQQLAEDEGAAFPIAAEVLKRDIYVDDVPCGANNVEDALILQQQLIGLMAKGKFELRKWASNEPSLLTHLPPEHCLSKSQTCDLDQDVFIKVLGLRWDPGSDQFIYNVQPINKRCSKRTILSELARIFDPLGFIAPVTFYAKCLVQKLWLQGVDWDEVPSSDIVDSWKHYIDQLPLLSQFSVPRYVTNNAAVIYQLHGFGDASEAGYGAVVYLRFELPDGSVRVHLLSAKSRVAPVKRVTLPRLELCAAVLLTDLLCYVIESLAPLLSPQQIFTWTDSMITLAWIQSSPMRWKTFIANRVSRIQRKLPQSKWNYVDTKTNPADCVSRGLMPKQLLEHPLWLSGPEWLVQPQDVWPSVQQVPSQALVLSEQEEKKTALVTTTNDDGILYLLFRFSCLKKIQRVLVYVQRFVRSARKLPIKTGNITSSEMEDALNLMVSRTQHQTFQEEIGCLANKKELSKPMRKLSPFLCEDSILRVGGRLNNAPLAYDARHPALLPSNHRLTDLIIQDVHESNMHPGHQAVQFLVAQKFWVLSARRAIKRCLHKCVRCFRMNPTPVQPIMADLPSSRVSGVKAFAVVGCDYAGPFNVIMGKRRRGARAQKAYLCLFVCFATKALHLEIATDLSSDAFIAALKRLVARRGRCSQIFSDCGTNFVGAYRQLTPLMNEAAKHEYISFSTHPPSGPHFSGLAEAGVKSTKTHLQRVVGSQLLTYEEIYTLVTQVESVLNSRPLCALSNDPNDLSVLTPGHFLTLEPLTAVPGIPDNQLSMRNRWHLLQRLHNDFWRRWYHDYLNSLSQRSKWTQSKGSLNLDDLVVIKEDNLKPLHWRLGRIVALHPGADGVARVATVRTDGGILKRPAVKLCPLPIKED